MKCVFFHFFIYKITLLMKFNSFKDFCALLLSTLICSVTFIYAYLFQFVVFILLVFAVELTVGVMGFVYKGNVS